MEKRNILVRVKVWPGARREQVNETGNNTFEIYVREPAQKNMANARVRELIAARFGVSKERAVIEQGHRSRGKLIRVIS